MAFVPIFTSHSLHAYFAFVVHLIQPCYFSTDKSPWVCKEFYKYAELTCRFTDPYHLHSRVDSVPTYFSHILPGYFECERIQLQFWPWKFTTGFAPSHQSVLFLFGTGMEISKSLCICRKYCLGCCKVCPVWLPSSYSGNAAGKLNMNCPWLLSGQ